MKSIWTITKRELRSFFDSLIAYILLIVFLGFSGFFTWLFGSDIFFIGQATLQPFFSIAYWTLFFFIPALTMRMLAEEKRSGTIELLLTKSVSDWQVIIGKFLSCLILIGIALGLTLPYYITVWSIGPIDHGAVWTGYLGMILMSMTYISIGLFASSITTNQIVAFLLSLFIGVFFLIIFDVLANNFTGTLGQWLNYMSLSSHYESVSRGVIDSKDLIYFLSITYFGLVLAETSLAKRNIVD
ncbi:MAG: ABC transporter permease subunit [Melioribacteraceae bacterium]|nr:ABC transporter permease subunit [Melioribacteraceae bacterium]MCF8355787.1 ABC transporter permease subunit [Melioribacteraceae bacterium]MCF8392823.1 ABC transporter permease subunit [Melioribacteraceae bacterium]MCF8418691.1 ABC transporter permease subunit [Melioribacteraceae bacterium]